jgi:sugar (pentulose or hexulose) kinase
VAGLMTGIYHSYSDVKRQIQIKDVFHPDKTSAEVYLPLHNIYESLYCHLKDAFSNLAKITNATDKNTV